jgi:hypothetical protein
MTQRQFLRLLRSDVDKAPTRWRAAERLDLSESSLSRVLSGKQEPSAALLKRYGLVRQIVYVPETPKRTLVNRKVDEPVDNSAVTCDTEQP